MFYTLSSPRSGRGKIRVGNKWGFQMFKSIVGAGAIFAVLIGWCNPVSAKTMLSSCQALTKPGELYVLTEDLEFVANANVKNSGCFHILADRIILDLNGHTLTGDGNGVGIDGADDNGFKNQSRTSLVIRNGTVEDFGYAIYFPDDTRVEVRNVKVLNNGAHGIFLGDRAVVRGNTLSGNEWTAIDVGAYALVEGNVINKNLIGGIVTRHHGTVRRNLLSNIDGSIGINVNGDVQDVRDNILDFAGEVGISAAWSRATVQSNVVTHSEVGIYVGECPSTVRFNRSLDNTINYDLAEGKGCTNFRNE